VHAWWERARQRLLNHDMHPLLREMYASSMKLSEPFGRELREFWTLPDDWTPEAY
jgi:hypothetical protein